MRPAATGLHSRYTRDSRSSGATAAVGPSSSTRVARGSRGSFGVRARDTSQRRRTRSQSRPPPKSGGIEHEYALERELRSAWAAQPVALRDHQGRTTLVLEDPGGELLDGLLRAPMELGLCLRVAVGLASALRQLHAQGIIHKDVKPANLLVETATGGVWLMGFGIASRLRREHQALEPPEVIAGSLPYMAPEQTGRMNRSIDSRSDLYAAGVTLYQMLTGGLPFIASDPMEWVHCHIARRPKPPGQRVQGIPA